MSLLGRLSIVGARRPAGRIPPVLMRRAEAERTLPVVCRNLGIPSPWEDDIKATQVRAAYQAAEIARGIEFLPLKGLHLAHHVYPSPTLRDMGDIDLLIRPRDLGGAHDALTRLGYATAGGDAPVVGGGDFLNAAVYVREHDLPVHLHWNVSNGSLPHFMYRIDAEEIRREARDGRMAPHHLVVTLCEHALKHSYEALIHFTDIELASREADPREVAGAARRWGLETAVAAARVLIRDLMEAEPAGLSGVRGLPRGPEGRALLWLARRHRWNGLSALGYLSMADGFRNRLRFVGEAMRPAANESGRFNSRRAGGRMRRAAAMVWEALTRRDYQVDGR